MTLTEVVLAMHPRGGVFLTSRYSARRSRTFGRKNLFMG